MIRVGTRHYERALGPAPMPRPCASCGRGDAQAKRTWMAPTVVGVPLFVFGDACEYTCAWCGTKAQGPVPRGAAALPGEQRFGGLLFVAFALVVYAVWFVGDKAVTAYDHYRRDREFAREVAEASAKDDSDEAKLAALREKAKAALADADAAEKSCMSALLTANVKRASEDPFWSRAKIPTTASPDLANTPYYGFETLEAERKNAAAVGGFACKVQGKAELAQMLATSAPTLETFQSLSGRVRTGTAACVPPPVVVVSQGGCKTDQHWCRVGLFWVEVSTKKVTAAATEDAPWKGEGANEPSTRAAMDRLRSAVASWKSAAKSP